MWAFDHLATVGVEFEESCLMSSRAFLGFSESCVSVWTIGVSSFGIVCQHPVVWRPEASFRFVRIVSASGWRMSRVVRRRSASVMSNVVARLVFAWLGILRRCRDFWRSDARCRSSNVVVWRPSARPLFIRISVSASRRYSSRRSASVNDRSVVWSPEARLSFILNLLSVSVHHASTLGVWFPVSFHVASRFSISLYLESWLGVCHPTSCRIASGGLPSLYSEFWVGFSTIGIAMLGVGQATLCGMASRGATLLCSESCVGFGTIFVRLGCVLLGYFGFS
jgi:hypothetical protein